MQAIAASDFIDILKEGVQRTSNFMALLTDFHGGPTKTEYILTSDIARAFLDKNQEVRVEYLNRGLVNVMTKRKSCSTRAQFGAQRTDVVVVHSGIVPKAMVEVKIGVGGSLGTIQKDLEKIAKTLQCMKAKIAANVRAASVFQIHIPGRSDDTKTHRLTAKMQKTEDKLAKKLALFGTDWPDFHFKLISLQGQNTGFVPTEVCEEEDGSLCLGQNGHATRYYAILITSLRQPPVATTFRERIQGD